MKNTKDPKFDHLNIEATNAASQTDFTGLIPSNPRTQDELDSYKAIHRFGPQNDTRKKEAGKTYGR